MQLKLNQIMETASLDGKRSRDASSDQWKSMKTRCVY